MRDGNIRAALRKLLDHVGEITIDEEIVIKGKDPLPEDVFWSMTAIGDLFGTTNVVMTRTFEKGTIVVKDWIWSDV